MRGVAVILVLLHHLSVPGFAYGYLGVDIFFVISGYVISSYVCRQVRDEKWSLGSFYRRRLWRLLPSLFAVLTCFLMAVLLSPASYQSEILNGFSWIVIGLGNLFFYFHIDYFANENLLNPLLHTWSLGVEEQFYLFFTPLLVFLAAEKRKFKHVFWCLAILTAIPLTIFSLVFVSGSEAWFYLLPARVYQFSAGIIAFYYVSHFNFFAKNAVASNGYGIALCLTALVILAYLAPVSTYASVVVTILVTLSLISSCDFGGKFFSSNKWLVWVGKISYSVYLVHWPIISFAHIYGLDIAAPVVALQIFLGSILLGAMLYYGIERYFYFDRSATQLLSIKWLVAYAACLIMASTLLAHFFSGIEEGKSDKKIHPNEGFINENFRLGKAEQTREASHRYRSERFQQIDYRRYFKENYKDRFQFGLYGQCFLSHGKGQDFDEESCLTIHSEKPNLFLFGDSHAAYFGAGIRQVFSDYHVSQSMVVGCYSIKNYFKNQTCLQHTEKSLQFAFEQEIDIVILYARWQERGFSFTDLGLTLQGLKQSGRRVILLAGSPDYRKHVARVLFDAKDYVQAKANAASLKPYSGSKGFRTKLAELAKEADVGFVDIADLICESGDNCEVLDENGIPLFYDYGHMTREGAVYIAERFRRSIGL